MLLLFALVDKLQSALKAPRKYQPASSSSSAASSAAASAATGGGSSGAASTSSDEWLARMKVRLQRYDQPLLKELTTVLGDFEDELLPAADATELLDAMGWLGDVMGESPDANTWLAL